MGHGSTLFNVQSPTAGLPPSCEERAEEADPGVLPSPDGDMRRFVALQVAFERQTLKSVFHLIGYRLWV
jgi:hypothetical protein